MLILSLIYAPLLLVFVALDYVQASDEVAVADPMAVAAPVAVVAPVASVAPNVPAAPNSISVAPVAAENNPQSSSLGPSTALSTDVIVPGPAPVVQDSGSHHGMDCTFAPTGLSLITGTIGFSAASNGSFQVDVKLQGFPLVGGPFMYHIHELPVPSNGDCIATKGHLNPFHGSISATDPQNKEIGDLSGKHGMIEGPNFEASYIDPYLSLNQQNPAYVGGLLIVIHYQNNTRLACANITSLCGGVANLTNDTCTDTVVGGTTGNGSTNNGGVGNSGGGTGIGGPGSSSSIQPNTSINATAAAVILSPLPMAAFAAIAMFIV